MDANKELEKYQIAEFKRLIEQNYVERKKYNADLLEKDYELSALKDELDECKNEKFDLRLTLGRKEAELAYFMTSHVFLENQLFEKYIFGDNLPSVKLLYMYFFENDLLKDCTWGSFCYSLQDSDNSTDITIQIPTIKDIGNETVGLLLYKLGQFCRFTRKDTLEVLYERFIVISASGKEWGNKEWKKYINPYDKVHKKPGKYDEIDKLFDKMESASVI